MNHPFQIPGAPAELMAIINAHRAAVPAGAMMVLGDGESAGAAQEGQQAPAGTDAPPAGQQATPAPAPAPATPPANESDNDRIARLERDLAAARSEAGKSRVNAKAQAAEEARNDLAQQIGKALGLVKDDTDKVDPKQLAAQLEASRADSRDRDAELIVWRNAATLGVNPAALTDSRAFAAAITKLDPTSPTFEADVRTAAQAAAETNPLLKAQAVAGKTGVEFTGGTGEQTPKPKNLAEALGRVYGA